MIVDGESCESKPYRQYGNKLAEVADELCSEWLRFGGCRPELYKRLQLAIDDWFEITEE